jgi:hypothetical protein
MYLVSFYFRVFLTVAHELGETLSYLLINLFSYNLFYIEVICYHSFFSN